MQPPNPAPVIRAAHDAGHAERDLDHRVELGRADLELVAQRRVAGREEPSERAPGRRPPGRDPWRRPGRSRRRRARRAGGRPGRAERAWPRASAGHVAQRRDRRVDSRASSATASSHWLRRALYSDVSRDRGEPVWRTTRTTSSGTVRPGATRATGSRAASPIRPRRTTRRTGPSARTGRRRSTFSARWQMRASVDRRRPTAPPRTEQRPGRGELDRGRRRQAGGGRESCVAMTPSQAAQRQAGLASAQAVPGDVVQPRPGRGRSASRSNRRRSPSSSRVSSTRPVVGRQVGDAGSRGRSPPAARTRGCSRCARR